MGWLFPSAPRQQNDGLHDELACLAGNLMGHVDLSSSSATLKCDFDQFIPLSKEGSGWESNLPRVTQPRGAGSPS